MNVPNQEREYVVTLSEAKGLSRWAARCFAALSMTILALVGNVHYRARGPTPWMCSTWIRVTYPGGELSAGNFVPGPT